MARKTTINDVARLAGVSIATADRVLNRRGGVNPDKEGRVLAAARSLKIDRMLARGYTHRMRVAVLIQSAANPFHAALAAAFTAAGRAYADLNVQFPVYHADPNRPERIAAAIDTLAQRHDGLIVTSPADAVVVAALRVAASSIPVVTLATDIPGSSRQAYVGPDDRQAGRVAGELMGRFLGASGGDVLMIAGLRALASHSEREDGFRAVLREYFPACLPAVQESGEDGDRAGQIALAALRDNPALKGIYHASAGAGPVVAALRACRRQDVTFITHELTEDRRLLLKCREIQAVIDQDPDGEVRAAVEVMAKLLRRLDGEPSSVFTPVRIYTAENV